MQMGIQLLDHGLPIQTFKGWRRQIADKWRADDSQPPTDAEISRLAAIQQCITALEAVHSEIQTEKVTPAQGR